MYKNSGRAPDKMIKLSNKGAKKGKNPFKMILVLVQQAQESKGKKKKWIRNQLKVANTLKLIKLRNGDW